MKFKYLFLGVMLLILAGSMTAIAAADTDDFGIVGDKAFTVPEDFEIINETDSNVYMENTDGNQSFVITVLDEDTDPEVLLQVYEDSGYTFNKTYSVYQRGIYRITELEFTYKDYIGLLFICQNGNECIFISHGFLDENDFPTDDDKVALELISSITDNI